MNELCSKGAGELAGMIASGEVTSAEVVDTYLARIEEVNPELNAVTVTLADGARVAASAVDRAVADGAASGRWPACRSPSRRTSTWPAPRRRGASPHSPSRSPWPTLR